ncbi:MAG: lipoyl synthase [Candidatus Gastranaerophilales bacterium]|nr:lipoyl synthase [Candidatus Gastranaerophilales bacterium]
MSRLPEYLKRPIIDTDKTKNVRRILRENCLNTVCESARCPNKNECYQKNTATFLIMGNVCTRNCRFCNISCEKPQPLDENEPANVAKAVQELDLKYVVITSVTRDDLSDGGAQHFAKCIEAVKCKVGRAYLPDNKYPSPEFQALVPRAEILSSPARGEEDNHSPIYPFTPSPQNGASPPTFHFTPIKVEILTPDFKGDTKALDTIIATSVDVFNHNIETVPRLYKIARPQAIYQRSLDVLKYVKDNSNILTKSGLMVGLGETFEELEQALTDLKNISCDIVTIGQYIQPSKEHLLVQKYYTLEEFEQLKVLAKKVGIKNYQIGPLVRSSYNASESCHLV